MCPTGVSNLLLLRKRLQRGTLDGGTIALVIGTDHGRSYSTACIRNTISRYEFMTIHFVSLDEQFSWPSLAKVASRNGTTIAMDSIGVCYNSITYIKYGHGYRTLQAIEPCLPMGLRVFIAEGVVLARLDRSRYCQDLVI